MRYQGWPEEGAHILRSAPCFGNDKADATPSCRLTLRLADAYQLSAVARPGRCAGATPDEAMEQAAVDYRNTKPPSPDSRRTDTKTMAD
jgi:hypothetical protein